MEMAADVFTVEWEMVPTRFWRVKSTIATFVLAAFTAGDYHPGRVPRSVVRIRRRDTGKVVYANVVRWDAQRAEGEAAMIKEDLESMDLSEFCEAWGIDPSDCV